MFSTDPQQMRSSLWNAEFGDHVKSAIQKSKIVIFYCSRTSFTKKPNHTLLQSHLSDMKFYQLMTDTGNLEDVLVVDQLWRKSGSLRSSHVGLNYEDDSIQCMLDLCARMDRLNPKLIFEINVGMVNDLKN